VTTPSDCPDENLLALLGEDAVDADTRAAIEAHLDQCRDCDRTIRELAGLAAMTEAPRPIAPVRYRVLHRLGEGGMGVVWAAEDRELHRKVALKVVRHAGDGDHGLRARLLREARLVATVRHANVVTIYDVGEHADQVYIAMELVEGTNARDWRGVAPRSSGEILAVWRAAAAGLAALHGAGVVHRDVKPDNVLVADDGRVVVCDLGLATDVDRVTTLTRTGQTLGTPAYMAPEQLRGEAVDARSDQFAWCVAVWEALTGARPYAGDTIAALALAIASGPPRASGEPAAVVAVLARGLDPDPARRWPALATLVVELERAERRPRSRPGAAAMIAVGAVAVTIGVIAIVLALGGRRPEATPAAALDAPAVGAMVATDAPAVGNLAMPDAAAAVAGPADAGRRADHPRTAPDARPTSPVAGGAAATDAPVGTAAADYRHLVDQLGQLSTAVAARDAAGCRRLVEQLVPRQDELGPSGVESVGVLRAQCEMENGECAAGRVRYGAYLRGRGMAEARQAAGMDDFDMRWCTFAGAGTDAQREKRVMWRLMMAIQLQEPCDHLVAEAEAAHVTPADPKYEMFAARCLARAGNCAEALVHVERGPAYRVAFERMFPACTTGP